MARRTLQVFAIHERYIEGFPWRREGLRQQKKNEKNQKKMNLFTQNTCLRCNSERSDENRFVDCFHLSCNNRIPICIVCFYAAARVGVEWKHVHWLDAPGPQNLWIPNVICSAPYAMKKATFFRALAIARSSCCPDNIFVTVCDNCLRCLEYHQQLLYNVHAIRSTDFSNAFLLQCEIGWPVSCTSRIKNLMASVPHEIGEKVFVADLAKTTAKRTAN